MVYLALSCLPQISCHTPLIAPKAPLLFQPISPLWGDSLHARISPFFHLLHSPPRTKVLSHFLFSSFFLLLSSYLVIWGSFLYFRCPRSSASVQFCENCYTCRCVLDTFVERDKLRVFLVLYHLDFSPINVI